MLEFIQANWELIGAALFAAASEIIGASPLKSNGVVQLILNTLSLVFKKK